MNLDKQEFKIPFMVLHRGDLEGELTKEQIANLTDDEMEEIAKLVGNALMQDWALCLSCSLDEAKQRFESLNGDEQ